MAGAADDIPVHDLGGAGNGTGPAAALQAIDVSDALGKANKGVQLSEEDRLRFARHILGFLFVTCLIVFAGYYFQPESKAAAAIFELVKIGVLPLVTLVIGFYFPNNSK